jgi:anti-anti-sigma regulatory factor
VRAGGQGAYVESTNLITIAMVVGGIVLSRLVADTMQAQVQENATRAEAARVEAEANAAALTAQAAELTRQNEEQRRLIDLVATLETPAVRLAEGVLLAPVVGHLDSRRAAALTERLLRDVSAARARLVVLDIAGVAAVDTGVAQALLRAVQAVRLLGCDVTITGISATVAATMTELGISMAGVHTARTPQEALDAAMGAMAGVAHKN